MVPYTATTQGIVITVRPVYLDHESDFFERRFAFGYFIEIENQSEADVQLMRRHWHIWEDSGRVQQVSGEGVIGQQPLIGPGKTHKYNSYCVLSSLQGAMEGYYVMERFHGERFRVEIPRFHLRARAN